MNALNFLSDVCKKCLQLNGRNFGKLILNRKEFDGKYSISTNIEGIFSGKISSLISWKKNPYYWMDWMEKNLIENAISMQKLKYFLHEISSLNKN